MAQLEDGGFGTKIEGRTFLTSTNGASLDELVENMMLAKQLFSLRYSDEELERAKTVFREKLRELRTYEEGRGGVVSGGRLGLRSGGRGRIKVRFRIEGLLLFWDGSDCTTLYLEHFVASRRGTELGFQTRYVCRW